ncbi:MAG TPA: hypothetical protein DEA08_02040, partial [Planctomycetes bacterium]|nr:hypothetical protein [Planctomycetota bacterium]
QEWRLVAEGQNTRSIVTYGDQRYLEVRELQQDQLIHATQTEAQWADPILSPLDSGEAALMAVFLGEGLPWRCKTQDLAIRLRLSERHLRRLLAQMEGRNLIRRVRAGRNGLWVHPGSEEDWESETTTVPSDIIGSLRESESFGLLSSNSLDPFPLDQARKVLVGRGPECSLRPASSSVSRHHAEITWKGGRFEVRDLGSTNGSFVNDSPATEPVQLQVGDTVRFGDAVYLFIRQGDDDDDHLADSTARLIT